MLPNTMRFASKTYISKLFNFERARDYAGYIYDVIHSCPACIILILCDERKPSCSSYAMRIAIARGCCFSRVCCGDSWGSRAAKVPPSNSRTSNSRPLGQSRNSALQARYAVCVARADWNSLFSIYTFRNGTAQTRPRVVAYTSVCFIHLGYKITYDYGERRLRGIRCAYIW